MISSEEKLKMAEEYGDNFGGAKNWLEIYKKATPNAYDFLHMDFQSNPPKAYHNFETLIAEGSNQVSTAAAAEPQAEQSKTEN